jgi:hypothetical protein
MIFSWSRARQAQSNPQKAGDRLRPGHVAVSRAHGGDSMDEADLIERLCAVAAAILEDASARVLVRDELPGRRVGSTMRAAKDVLAISEAAMVLLERCTASE